MRACRCLLKVGLPLLLVAECLAQVGVPGNQLKPGVPGQPILPGQPGNQLKPGVPGQPANPQGMARNVGLIAYRNDTGMPIIVQGASVAPNGKPQLGPPHPINPGGTSWDQVAGIGPKVITVYDAKQKVLFQGPVLFNGQNLFFSIQATMMQKGNEKVPVARLVPLAGPGLAMPSPQGLMPLPNQR